MNETVFKKYKNFNNKNRRRLGYRCWPFPGKATSPAQLGSIKFLTKKKKIQVMASLVRQLMNVTEK